MTDETIPTPPPETTAHKIEAEAKSASSKAIAWAEGHPALMGWLAIGLLIGFVLGYLIGSI